MRKDNMLIPHVRLRSFATAGWGTSRWSDDFCPSPDNSLMRGGGGEVRLPEILEMKLGLEMWEYHFTVIGLAFYLIDNEDVQTGALHDLHQNVASNQLPRQRECHQSSQTLPCSSALFTTEHIHRSVYLPVAFSVLGPAAARYTAGMDEH